MDLALYFRRLLVMLLLAMPLTSALLALSGSLRHSSDGALNTLGGALLLVYVWGAITGSILSAVHTTITRRSGGAVLSSVGLGVLLGLLAGALTPTPFTGLFLPTAIALGGTTGLLYALLVETLPFAARRGGA